MKIFLINYKRELIDHYNDFDHFISSIVHRRDSFINSIGYELVCIDKNDPSSTEINYKFSQDTNEGLYIVKSEDGQIIKPSLIRTKLDEEKAKKTRLRNKKNHYYFRNGPVPYIGISYRYRYKNPQTQQQFRENSFLKYDEDAIEFHIKSRAKRRCMERGWWWEKPKYRWRRRSWKNYRKTQWHHRKIMY